MQFDGVDGVDGLEGPAADGVVGFAGAAGGGHEAARQGFDGGDLDQPFGGGVAVVFADDGFGGGFVACGAAGFVKELVAVGD